VFVIVAMRRKNGDDGKLEEKAPLTVPVDPTSSMWKGLFQH
jgi:hypothetical protein